MDKKCAVNTFLWLRGCGNGVFIRLRVIRRLEMIDETWLRALIREAIADREERHRRRREFPGFTQKQIEAGLTVPATEDAR